MKHLDRFLSIGLLLAMAAFPALAQEAAPATQTTQEQLDSLREVVTDPEGAIQTAVSDVNNMKKIKMSGYLQVRWDAPQGKPSTFALRRARIKFAASPSDHTLVTIQPDFAGANPTTEKPYVSLKDVSIDWFPTAVTQEQSWNFTLGQTVLPFGYENVASSSILPFGERSTVVRQSFPDEYDKGLKVSTPVTWPLNAQFGVFNGTGPSNRSGQGFNDVNSQKDWVGRLRWAAMPALDLGVSAYVGRQTIREATAAVAAGSATTGFVDSNGNGVKDAGEATIVVPGSAAVAARPAIVGNKTRYGLDAQWWPLNGLALKGEYIAGKSPAVANNALRQLSVQGYYAQATYDFMPAWTFGLKYDAYKDGTNAASSNNISTWNIGLINQITQSTRVLYLYNVVHERYGKQQKNNLARIEVVSIF